jgi:hypothetical protein
MLIKTTLNINASLINDAVKTINDFNHKPINEIRAVKACVYANLATKKKYTKKQRKIFEQQSSNYFLKAITQTYSPSINSHKSGEHRVAEVNKSLRKAAKFSYSKASMLTMALDSSAAGMSLIKAAAKNSLLSGFGGTIGIVSCSIASRLFGSVFAGYKRPSLKCKEESYAKLGYAKYITRMEDAPYMATCISKSKKVDWQEIQKKLNQFKTRLAKAQIQNNSHKITLLESKIHEYIKMHVMPALDTHKNLAAAQNRCSVEWASSKNTILTNAIFSTFRLASGIAGDIVPVVKPICAGINFGLSLTQNTVNSLLSGKNYENKTHKMILKNLETSQDKNFKDGYTVDDAYHDILKYDELMKKYKHNKLKQKEIKQKYKAKFSSKINTKEILAGWINPCKHRMEIAEKYLNTQKKYFDREYKDIKLNNTAKKNALIIQKDIDILNEIKQKINTYDLSCIRSYLHKIRDINVIKIIADEKFANELMYQEKITKPNERFRYLTAQGVPGVMCGLLNTGLAATFLSINASHAGFNSGATPTFLQPAISLTNNLNIVAPPYNAADSEAFKKITRNNISRPKNKSIFDIAITYKNRHYVIMTKIRAENIMHSAINPVMGPINHLIRAKSVYKKSHIQGYKPVYKLSMHLINSMQTPLPVNITQL